MDSRRSWRLSAGAQLSSPARIYHPDGLHNHACASLWFCSSLPGVCQSLRIPHTEDTNSKPEWAGKRMYLQSQKGHYCSICRIGSEPSSAALGDQMHNEQISDRCIWFQSKSRPELRCDAASACHNAESTCLRPWSAAQSPHLQPSTNL